MLRFEAPPVAVPTAILPDVGRGGDLSPSLV